MNIKSFSLGPLGTNCYIIQMEKKALIVDPGGDAETIIDYLDTHEIEPLGILLTHAHFDHIGGVEYIRNHYNIDVYLHTKEKDWLTDAKLNGSLLFMNNEVTTKKPDCLLTPGNIEIGPFKFEVIHTPGHSPGSVSFIFTKDKNIISGDVLFQGGVGRTDLPQGDFNVLVHSLKEKLYKLPEEFIVYPGHGDPTTIGKEKNSNPFVQG